MMIMIINQQIKWPFDFVASPAMRGSTPLDVAASSVMDNNGLALALEEPDLDKVKPRPHPVPSVGP